VESRESKTKREMNPLAELLNSKLEKSILPPFKKNPPIANVGKKRNGPNGVGLRGVV
jgi:hypothetical protein